MYIMMMGPIGCGKTTLCQTLAGLPKVYVKTQTVGIIGKAIDTPGEYIENRTLWNRLVVSAVDSRLVLFLLDPTNMNFRFSPGQAAMFSSPVIGVITKIDLAGKKAITQAEELLALAGASPVFALSSQSGRGVKKLAAYIQGIVKNPPHF
jgi:ethanolamine utilization protein EutP